eukprot:CAMPEP_0197451676 /NCGR_PEP_ID=MMETSP1175-20131217/29783_1 /TAXON_ID=1003142 /ORGANISM="Triceratium dubium, Strain CCMP147" /LENGTH=216 /DNA_ID=CAMNT_0042984479 /DNA_START=164 /DNA_END=814 /DNA_ORIENTATION=-
MAKLLKTDIPNILATRVEYPFGGTTTKTSAFLIKRPGGNAWVYSSSHAGDYIDHVAELGGVNQQLLNHRDEASKFSNVLDSPVFCHELEKEAIEQRGCVVSETYTGKQHKFGDDLIAYHTPGHTRGVTSYVWKSGDTTVLFPGDTLYPNEEGILAHGPLQFYAYEGNVQDMIATLKFFVDLDPTYVISGLTQSDSFVNKFQADQVREIIRTLSEAE